MKKNLIASFLMATTFGLVSCGKGEHNLGPAQSEELTSDAVMSAPNLDTAEESLSLSKGAEIETEGKLKNWELYVNSYEDLKLFWIEASKPGTLVGENRYSAKYKVSTDGWEQSFVTNMNAFFITNYSDMKQFTISQFGKYHFTRHGRGEGRKAPGTNLDYARYVKENKDVAIWYADMQRPGINGPGLYTKTYGHDTTSWEAHWLMQMNKWFAGSNRTDPGQFGISLYGKFHYESYGIREGRKIFPKAY